jgi:hypothetical protein
MFKYLAIFGALLYARKAYADRLKKVNAQTQKKVVSKEAKLDSIEE